MIFPWRNLLRLEISSLLLSGLVSAHIIAAPALAVEQLAQPSPPQSQQPAVLGVIRATETEAQWQDILDRVETTGLNYRIIDWPTVTPTTDFNEVTVLFLANVTTITSEQLLGLRAWLNRGGRLIVSGAVGSQSSLEVRNALRSLLGAYWASNLAQPQTLQPLRIASQRWVQNGDTSGAILGGIVVPASLASQPVAVWHQPGSDAASLGAAVVVTQKSTFFGWRWGDRTSSASLDSSWLRAAVSRFDGLVPLPPVTSAQPLAESPRSTAATAPMSPEIAASVRSPATAAAPASPSRNSAAFDRPPAPIAIPPVTTTPVTTTPVTTTPVATTTRTTQDPAEQVAPAELDIRPNTRITLYEATRMRQDLNNLIGRYEGALILTQSQANIAAVTDKAIPDSATNDRSSRSHDSNRLEPLLDDDILVTAKQGYRNFTEAVRQQDYASARQQWLDTRQLLQTHFPLNQSLAQPEVRAIWLDRGTIVQAGSRPGLAQIFDRLAAAGINTVFFETINAGYPIYPSQVAPAQNPLTQQWDPLAAAVDLAHERGIELHAWVWTFAAGNQRHNAILNQSASYPGPVLAAHPDWANYDDRGFMIPPGQTKPFLDPANPEVRRYLMQLFEEIVSRYNVDGLQLDYIRYPFQDPRSSGHTYGYGIAARRQFQQLTGVDPITLSPNSQSPLWQQWTQFRTEQISSFVADVSQQLHQLKPSLVLSTAVFALPEQQRLNMIQQDWETWAKQGDVDMIVLMSYASDTNGLQRLAEPWLAKADLQSTLVLPGIRLLNLSDQTIVEQIQTLRDSMSGGFALFAAENLSSQLQTIFHQTQGATPNPIPYRQPFEAAASRYQVLLRQWNWLLDRGHIHMSEQQRQTWRSQTEALDQALQAAAVTPSPVHIDRAQALLKSFQTQFKRWMTLPELSQDYRVQTWENQLATLNILLNYGERVMVRHPLQAGP